MNVSHTYVDGTEYKGFHKVGGNIELASKDGFCWFVMFAKPEWQCTGPMSQKTEDHYEILQ